MDSKIINFEKIKETLQSIKCNDDHQGQRIVNITGEQRQRVQLFKLFCTTCKSTSQEQEVICDFPEQLIQMLKQQGQRLENEEQEKVTGGAVEDSRKQFEAIKQKIEEVQSFLKTLKQFVEQRLNDQSQTQEKPNLKDIYYRMLIQIESCSTKSELQQVLNEIASLNYPSERKFQIQFESLLNNKLGPIKGASNERESENYEIISKINSVLSPLLKIADKHEHYERKSNDFGKFLINLREETNQISDQLNSFGADTTVNLLKGNETIISEFKGEYRGQITQNLKNYLEKQTNENSPNRQEQKKNINQILKDIEDTPDPSSQFEDNYSNDELILKRAQETLEKTTSLQQDCKKMVDQIQKERIVPKVIQNNYNEIMRTKEELEKNLKQSEYQRKKYYNEIKAIAQFVNDLLARFINLKKSLQVQLKEKEEKDKMIDSDGNSPFTRRPYYNEKRNLNAGTPKREDLRPKPSHQLSYQKNKIGLQGFQEQYLEEITLIAQQYQQQPSNMNCDGVYDVSNYWKHITSIEVTDIIQHIIIENYKNETKRFIKLIDNDKVFCTEEMHQNDNQIALTLTDFHQNGVKCSCLQNLNILFIQIMQFIY